MTETTKIEWGISWDTGEFEVCDSEYDARRIAGMYSKATACFRTVRITSGSWAWPLDQREQVAA